MYFTCLLQVKTPAVFSAVYLLVYLLVYMYLYSLYLRECSQRRYMFELHGLHLDLVASSYTLHYFGWVSIRLQVHTLTRRPPVAPTNCPIHSSAGDGRRPWLVISALLRNFPTASACWQPASHSFIWARQHKRGGTRGRSSALTDELSIGPFLSIFKKRGGAKRGRWTTDMPLNLRLVRWLALHALSHASSGELRRWNDTVGKLVGSYGWTSVSPDTRCGYAL